MSKKLIVCYEKVSIIEVPGKRGPTTIVYLFQRVNRSSLLTHDLGNPSGRGYLG